MPSATKLIQQGRNGEIWTKYCGFLDLDLDEYMDIQERLLLEQIDLLSKSMMGRMLMGDFIPSSVEEFREIVPLTTYEDYVGYLDKKREDVLPRKPYMWSHTSGRSGDYRFKWVPYTKKMYDRLGEVVIGSMLLATCSKKGEVRLEPGDTVLLATAPPPYVSGLLTYSLKDQFEIQFLPSLAEGDEMDFRERIQSGFKLAMRDGLDYFYGIASVLVGIGEQFEAGSGSTGFSLDMLRPSVLYRLLKAFISAKLKNKNPLPKDIWNLKGIMTGGTDTSVYKNKVEYFWGRKPLEGYACTEGGTMAVQAWNYQGLTFFPDNNFLEFIPYDEHKKSQQDPDYQPETVLFDELEEGIYELVFTNFHGGIFTRYRVGDLFEVVAMEDEEIGIKLPQTKFYSRAQDIISLAGFTLLTEQDLWFAVENSGEDYREWVARKEVTNSKPHLHLFVELDAPHKVDAEKFRSSIDQNLSKVNPDYQDMKDMLVYDPLKLTLLRPGSFGAYMDYQQSQGADLAHTKPPHMQPSKEQLHRLMKGKRVKEK